MDRQILIFIQTERQTDRQLFRHFFSDRGKCTDIHIFGQRQILFRERQETDTDTFFRQMETDRPTDTLRQDIHFFLDILF